MAFSFISTTYIPARALLIYWPMKVILHLTSDCNLRCRYCYAPAKTAKNMSVATAKKAIDMALELGERSACVSYFGGEPLLHFDRIRELTAYALAQAKSLDKDMHFRMSTNGILFDQTSLAFCREHNILYAISLDGDKLAHDAQRIFADGTGSYDALDAKLDMILEYNPHAVFTSVITPPTASRLLSSVESMWSRGIRYFVMQPDYTHPDWGIEDLQRLEDSYLDLAGFYLEKIRAGQAFHFSLFDDKIKSHAHSPFAPGKVCDFGAKKVSVAPDGHIFPCVQFVSDRPDAKDFCIGHVERGMDSRREHLVAKNQQPRAQCVDCALNGRCSNFCGCLNWQTTGSILKVPGLLCAHERMLIPIADEIGNELWAEKNKTFLHKHYKDYENRFPYAFD
ncbi:MAG: radical SAM protein [Deltaproteobacteria bacterium]|nr:radical SAM protein [Deltaproteobacteria bacterium]